MVAAPIRINWDEEEKSSFEAKTPGKYHAKITGGEMKKSEKGNSYLAVEFTFQAPETGKAWLNVTMTKKTLWRVRQFLVATGQFTDDELQGDNFEFTVEDILGADVILDTTVEEYNGKDQTRVKEVLLFDEALIGQNDW